MKYTIIYSGVSGDSRGSPQYLHVETDDVLRYITKELNYKDGWDVAFIFSDWMEPLIV